MTMKRAMQVFSFINLPGKYRFISSAENLSNSLEFRMTILESSLEIIRNVGSVPRNMV